MSKKFFSKNHKFSSKIAFFTENGNFLEGLDEAGCRDRSRMKEGIFLHRLRPRKNPPTITIKRYELFSDQHFRKIWPKNEFLDFWFHLEETEPSY